MAQRRPRTAPATLIVLLIFVAAGFACLLAITAGVVGAKLLNRSVEVRPLPHVRTSPPLEPPPRALTDLEIADERLRQLAGASPRPWRKIAELSGQGEQWTELFNAEDYTVRLVCVPGSTLQTLDGEVEQNGAIVVYFGWPAEHLTDLGGQFVATDPGDVMRVKVTPSDDAPWKIVVQSK